MGHYYKNVPGLGSVAVSRHAQYNIRQQQIPESNFIKVLFESKSLEEGFEVVRREGFGIRIIILLNPTPFKGAKLVKSVFSIKPQKDSKHLH
jgi:hypothetical protein